MSVGALGLVQMDRLTLVGASTAMSVDPLGSVQTDRLTLYWSVGASAPILVVSSELVQLHRIGAT